MKTQQISDINALVFFKVKNKVKRNQRIQILTHLNEAGWQINKQINKVLSKDFAT